MKIDIEALGRLGTLPYPSKVKSGDIAALVRIARAAAEWRDSAPNSAALSNLIDALRDAGI